MSDKCMRCIAEAAPIGNDPECGAIYQSLHNPDHQFVIIGNAHLMLTVKRPSTSELCEVFRCAAKPSRIWPTDRPGRKVEKGVCDAHGAVLDGGGPWTRGPNGTILMGKDYSVATRKLG
jgi:hypothetical protein